MKKSEVPPNLAKLVEKSSEQVTDEDYDLAKMWFSQDAENSGIAMQETNNSSTLAGNSGNLVQTTLPSGHHALPQYEIDFSRSNNATGISQEDCILHPYLDSVTDSLPLQDNLLAPPLINLETSGLRQLPQFAALNNNNSVPAIVACTTSTMPISSRQITRPRPHHSFLLVFNLVGSLWTFATTNSHSDNEMFSFVAHFSNNLECLNGLFNDTINDICHEVHAYAKSNESFTYLQMLQEDDHKQFFEAMEVKLADHEFQNHWTLMERKDLPFGTKTIMAIWSFKHKRFPNGTLNKHKARLCAHGGQQTWGQDYWETYASVVTWARVTLLLIVAKIHGLESKSIDFVLAFPPADLDVPVYMELTVGVNLVDILDENQCCYVLKLKKSLY
jgi:hypothetical protein